MSDRPTDHPSEEILLARLDEPVEDPGLDAHLAGCERCRERLGALEGVLTALAAEPSRPDPAALAAQRDRILAALPDRAGRRTGVASLAAHRRWRWWAPALAAAAVAAVVVLGRVGSDGPPSPAADATAVVDRAGASDLPAVAEAERAAEEIYVAAVGGAEDAPGAGEALVALEATTIDILDGEDDPVLGSPGLDDAFASLPTEAQREVLSEMETMTFEL